MKGVFTMSTKITADIGIIAAGPAGLCAAASAAEAGCSVVVFEKAAGPGGAANMGMGPFAVESRVQQRALVNLTKEDAFRRYMDYVHWQVDAQLVHDYIWKSGDTINWLEDMGVEFAGVMKNFPASEQTWHVVKPEGGGIPGPRSASAMNKVLHQYCLDNGVKFYFNTPVQKLVKTDNAVTGFIAASLEGEEYEVEAKAVIIATGGFGTNPEMIKQYCGYDMGKDIFTFNIPGIVGDGIKMAWEAGAGKSRMEMEKIAAPNLPGANLGQWPQATLFMQAGPLAINKSGYRCCDESIMQNGSVGANIVDFQQDHVMYKITSDDMIKYYRRNGMDFPNEVFGGDPTIDFDANMTRAEEEYPQLAFTASSLEELAEKIGIDADNLIDTVDRYNDMCDENYDDDFGKNRNYLHPLTGKKFYALEFRCNAYGSLGGIKINHNYEVITDDYKVIPGLYAAGTDVCDIYNGTYYYYFPGNTMGFAVNSGRMAGENAADYVQE